MLLKVPLPIHYKGYPHVHIIGSSRADIEQTLVLSSSLLTFTSSTPGHIKGSNHITGFIIIIGTAGQLSNHPMKAAANEFLIIAKDGEHSCRGIQCTRIGTNIRHYEIKLGLTTRVSGGKSVESVLFRDVERKRVIRAELSSCGLHS